MSSEQRLQHLVPSSYLARFADRRGRITVVSRARPSDRHTLKVTEAATFRDFYTLQHLEGADRYALERALSDVEAAGLDAVRRLCDDDGQLTGEQRSSLCRLAAFQRVRGQRVRRAGEAMSTVLQRVMPSAWTDPEGNLVDGVRRTDTGEFHPDPEHHLRTLVTSARQIERVWVNWRLRLLRFDQPVLLTSDEPVQCTKYPGGNPFEGVGAVNADEVWFPLDPRCLLVLSPRPTGGGWFDATDQQTAAVVANRAVAGGAYADIFVTPGRNPLGAFDLPPVMPVVGVAAPHDFDIDGVNAPPLRVTPRRR